MMRGQEICSLVAERQDPNRFRRENWEGSFQEYLDVVRENPRVTRNAFERIYDMILSYGAETYDESRENRTHYRFFEDPLDGGLDAGRRFVDKIVLNDFYDLVERQDYVNFKSKLLELTQSKGCGHPKYLVNAEEGPDHDKTFSVEVSMTGESLGNGQGRSKKEAQQMAAKDALKRLGAL